MTENRMLVAALEGEYNAERMSNLQPQGLVVTINEG